MSDAALPTAALPPDLSVPSFVGRERELDLLARALAHPPSFCWSRDRSPGSRRS